MIICYCSPFCELADSSTYLEYIGLVLLGLLKHLWLADGQSGADWSGMASVVSRSFCHSRGLPSTSWFRFTLIAMEVTRIQVKACIILQVKAQNWHNVTSAIFCFPKQVISRAGPRIRKERHTRHTFAISAGSQGLTLKLSDPEEGASS